ncbi:MAG TPA: sugar phosphate nucleotidyltransferase [Polyangiaceae bacterium]|nr:sugar phosphate nucleotidyltransferase [Polyangiaceae bacterium]
MQVVVLAHDQVQVAGTPSELPAPLVTVRGRAFVDWQLDAFVASGARSIVMCVGVGGEEIETHVRRAMDRGLMVAYSYAGTEASGSGSAVRRAYARLEDDFVLTHGDCYLPFDYAAPLRDLRDHPQALATLGVRRKPNPSGAGQLSLDGDWVSKYETGSRSPELDYVDGGVVALRRAALSDVADGAVWGIEALWRRLARQRQLRAFVMPERGYDVRTPEARLELEQHLQGQPHDGPAL